MVVVGLNAKCRCCPAVSFRIIYKERFPGRIFASFITFS